MEERKRKFIAALCTVLLICIFGLYALCTAHPEAQKRPNIVMLMTDDTGSSCSS